MKLFKNLIVVTVVLFGMSTVSSARSLVWRDCGIGAMIFPEIDWAAVISNIIWDLGTTATSSHVSSPDTCKGKQYESALFIHESYDNLIEETAKGKGEHLHALLDVLECTPRSQPAIIQSIRKELPGILNSEVYDELPAIRKSENYHILLLKTIETQYSPHCNGS